MSYGTIRLEPDEEITDVTDFAVVHGWWIDGNIITIDSKDGRTVWRLPRGRARVSLHRLGKGRARLVVAGFTTVTVEVVGPEKTLRKLMEEL